MEESDEEIEVPRIHNKRNIHNGPQPHIAIAVEDISDYFTKDGWQNCVSTIRTIGLVRRLENESYVVENFDDSLQVVRIPLTRGTNRQLKVSRLHELMREVERDHMRRKKPRYWETEENVPEYERGGKRKLNDLPFPDSVRDPELLGDRRVTDGEVYMILGTIKWSNGAPIIDVHRFIEIEDLESTLETFMLQYTIARRRVDLYKAHPDEMRKIVRRPEAVRTSVIDELVKTKPWKGKGTRRRKFGSNPRTEDTFPEDIPFF